MNVRYSKTHNVTVLIHQLVFPATVGAPVVAEGIEEIEIDHRWHFLGAKKTKNGSSRRWMVTAGELSAGLPVVMEQG